LAETEAAMVVVDVKLACPPALMEAWSWSESQPEDELKNKDKEAKDNLRWCCTGSTSSDVGEETREDDGYA
jgi:hypothetical protein